MQLDVAVTVFPRCSAITDASSVLVTAVHGCPKPQREHAYSKLSSGNNSGYRKRLFVTQSVGAQRVLENLRCTRPLMRFAWMDGYTYAAGYVLTHRRLVYVRISTRVTEGAPYCPE